MMSVAPQTLREIVSVLDFLGVAVFAVTGALAAARRRMDPVGFVVIGLATGIGGGTLRDLVLGVRPVFWVSDQAYLAVSVAAALSTFWAARWISRLSRALVWMDAVGMAMFAVSGTQKAHAMGADPVVAALMGIMTASFGGLMRDVLCGEKPMLFHRDIYALAALAGAVVWLALAEIPGISEEIRSAIAFLAAFGVRGWAIHWRISLPRHGGTGPGSGD